METRIEERVESTPHPSLLAPRSFFLTPFRFLLLLAAPPLLGPLSFTVLFAADSTEAERVPEAELQLGGLGFRPTPERPIGWRGDWTGRFPGATPPLQWSRRVKGITTELRYQARKPAGEPSAVDGKSCQLEYFTIKDWLVAGPFAVDDPVKDIGRDLLGGEATLEPDAGAPPPTPSRGGEGAGGGPCTWTPLHVNVDTQSRHDHNEGTCGNSSVDFIYIFGKIDADKIEKIEGDFNNKAAYAHTYIHSPREAKVRLRMPFAGSAARFWLNGIAADLDPRNREKLFDATLAQGWNRLLVKVSAGQGLGRHYTGRWLSDWLVAAYVEPVPPVSYETTNIAWMTKMTGRSMSQPILVGDRIYVGSGMTDLLCLEKKSGKVLWLRSNTPYDALTEEQRAAIPELKEKIGPLAAKLNALNAEVVAALNAAISSAGLSSGQQADVDKTLTAKREAERAVHNAFRAMDRKKYPPMYENEVSSSNATPLSDGQHVYWVCGGGMKGPGSHVIACFDLDGKRVWSWHDGGSLGSLEHGNHISPNLVDGKLIYAANAKLLALDAKTGKELWRNSPNDWQNGGHGSTSPLVVRIGDAKAIIQMRYIHRASDGTVICPSNLDVWGILTPIVENSVVFNPSHWRGWKDPVSFIGVKLPASVAAGAKAETVLDLAGKDVTMPVRMAGPTFMVASPLYVDGVVYSIEMGGGLAAVDTAARKALCRQYLDGYNRYNRFLYGVAASPALGGKNIYIIDDAGYTHILQPGPQLKELGHNVLENIQLSGLGGNPCKQESFYTSPVFEGGCMYLRGEEYLYCIGQE